MRRLSDIDWPMAALTFMLMILSFMSGIALTL